MVQFNGNSPRGEVMTEPLLNRVQNLDHDRQRLLARMIALEVSGSSGASRSKLCAYLVPSNGQIDLAKLGEWLSSRLPDYMVPDNLVALEKLPRRPNGKLDTTALPAPELPSTSTDEITAPRNSTEETLAQIWSDLLNLDEISIHDDFFEIGGDSIVSIQVLSRARQVGILLQPQDFIENTTIAELAMVASEIESAANELSNQSNESRENQYLFRLDGIGNNILYARVSDGESHPTLAEPKLIRSNKTYARETRLEEVAEDYVRLIREIQPAGPYMFISLDCGAHVTYEVAQQLLRQDEQTTFFGVVEADAPLMSRSNVGKYLTKGVEYLRRGDFRGLLAGLRLTFRRGVGLVPKTSKTGKPMPFNHGLTINNYLPSSYPGRITVFHSVTYHKQRGGRSNVRQWTELAANGIDVVVVDAEFPLDILAPANIPYLEERLPLQT